MLSAKIRLSLEANGLSSVVYLSRFHLDKGRTWRRGLRLQVAPTIPPSNDDFRSENLFCSSRCRFLWQARPQELALFRLVMMIFVPKIFLAPVDVDSCGKLGRKNSHYVPSPNLLEDGILSNFAVMNGFVSSNKISFVVSP